MPDDIAIEARIPQALDEALDRLALMRGKSKSSLVCEVLDAFVRGEEEFIAAVEEGRAAARAGELIDHHEVVGEIDPLIAAGRGDRPDGPGPQPQILANWSSGFAPRTL